MARAKKTKLETAYGAPVVSQQAMPPDTRNSLRNRAILVNLSVHEWKGSVTDEKITGEVAVQHGIQQDMGEFKKRLFSKKALAKLVSAAGKIRATHKRLTLPWDEWGTRVCTNVSYIKYASELNKLIGEYQQIVVDELLVVGPTGKIRYEEKIDEAAVLLNGAFRRSEYPSVNEIQRKFGAEIKIFPIPEADDIRVDVPAELLEQTRLSVQRQTDSKVEDAMSVLFDRLKGVVNNLVTALKSEKEDAVRATHFTGIARLLETLPLLNITGNIEIEAFAAEVKAAVQGYDAKELREVPTQREALLAKTDAILQKMNGFLS